jgi:hypothetical protein
VYTGQEPAVFPLSIHLGFDDDAIRSGDGLLDEGLRDLAFLALRPSGFSGVDVEEPQTAVNPDVTAEVEIDIDRVAIDDPRDFCAVGIGGFDGVAGSHGVLGLDWIPEVRLTPRAPDHAIILA